MGDKSDDEWWDLHTVEVPKAKCLGCGQELDQATGPDENPTVTPGCVSICAVCGYAAAWTEDLQFRELTEEERTHPDVMRMQLSVAQMITDRRRKETEP